MPGIYNSDLSYPNPARKNHSVHGYILLPCWHMRHQLRVQGEPCAKRAGCSQQSVIVAPALSQAAALPVKGHPRDYDQLNFIGLHFPAAGRDGFP